jgi:hypothetical protein
MQPYAPSLSTLNLHDTIVSFHKLSIALVNSVENFKPYPFVSDIVFPRFLYGETEQRAHLRAQLIGRISVNWAHFGARIGAVSALGLYRRSEHCKRKLHSKYHRAEKPRTITFSDD